ncbi:MAG: hypothetical protein IJK77_01020 [Lachnospiraceae bacterium]|nr:hypothetical protein [Lachnospiraceae bacterium]
MQEVIISGMQSLYGLEHVPGNVHAKIDKNGMHFFITTYKVKGFGYLSVIDMKAMFGLMKMESVVLNATHRDLPLYSGDLIKVAGKCTLLQEFYNTMIDPMTEDAKAPYRKVKEKYKGLAPYETGPHWYDDIRYDFTLGATGKELKDKERTITKDYFDAYLENVAIAPACDPEEKKAKTKAYVDGLFKNGGPAVDQFKKLIGDEAAREVFEKYVFCCR